MKQYKIIKDFPGGPIGQTCYIMPNSYYESYPEYYEEVVEYYYIVLLRDSAFSSAWEPIKVIDRTTDTEYKKCFSSKEEAEDYVVMNKPCLAIVDIFDAFPKYKLDYFKKIVNERP